MAKICLDSNILFEAVENHKVSTFLRRLERAGHELYAPLTVLGEITLICVRDERRDDLNKFLDFCWKDITINFLIPSSLLRECCSCMDEANDSLDITDKTHVAYATAHGMDYFLTEDKYLQGGTIRCDSLKIVSMENLRAKLL